MSAAARGRADRVLAFRRGGRVFGLEGRFCREVTPLASLTPVPLAAGGLLGLGNLRGTPLPVIDLALLLGLDAEPWACPLPVHVTAVDGTVAGLAIDEVAGFEPWPAGDPLPLDAGEPQSLRRVARFSLPFRDGRVLCLDLRAVLELARRRLAAGEADVPS